MTDNDNDQSAEDVTGERTSAFRADFTNAQDAAATAGAEGQLFGAEALEYRLGDSGARVLVTDRAGYAIPLQELT